MKKILHFNQGPLMGREVEVDLDPMTIQSLLDTGYCTDVPDPPEPVRKVVERAVVAEVAPEPVAEPVEEKPKKAPKKRKKRQTPEG